ncbi:MAG: PilZ domain-containing protein [Desulfovibrionaceae bacterium]
MANEFSFQLSDDAKGSRAAYRARVPGLEAWVEKHSFSFSVMDLSAAGIGLMDSNQLLTAGELLEFDLLLNKKLILSRCTARVMRILNNGLAGCTFEALDRHQEALLDKLVLEVQKRMIALRKTKAAQED